LKVPRKEGFRMPTGDGTGPMGMGPMTGRAAGYCAGYGSPGFMSPVYRRPVWGPAPGYPPGAYRMPWMLGRFFRGRGFGRGRGRGRWWF
jgi:hypothetical protein